MKNRERLMKTNPCDLLKQMQRNIDYAAFHIDCVLTVVVGEDANMEGRDYCDRNCDKCIEAWMNEEDRA